MPTAEQSQAHWDANVSGGLKGTLLAIGISVPGITLLQRNSPFFRAMPLPLKALGVVVVTVPCVTIAAEKAGEAYERSQWTGVGVEELKKTAKDEENRWSSMTTGEKIGDWSKRNKFGILGVSWAGAMVGSFAAVSRGSQMTFAQKLVQARVYAQAGTIVLLIAAAVLSNTGKEEEEFVPAKTGDHSWRNILEQEGLMEKEKGDPVRAEQLKGAAEVAAPRRGE